MINNHFLAFAKKPYLVFTLCVLCVLCAKLSAQTFKQLHPGVEYAQVSHKLGDDPVKINLLRLDLKKVRLDVHHALDKAIGLETTSSIAKRKNAVAAINAGFFRLDKSQWAGEAAGILKIDGTLLSESQQNRVALAIRNNRDTTVVDFSHIETGLSLSVGVDSMFPVHGINRERKTNELILFTSNFGPSTQTGDDGSEYAVKYCCKKLPQGGGVEAVFEGKGNSPIRNNGYVISANGKWQDQLSSEFKHILYVHWNITYSFLDQGKADFFLNAEDITNGVPQLIKNGKIDITWEQEKASKSFAETRHPRTAVAKLRDGKFLMMTVDGRQPGVSVGMSLQELAEYLFSLGAIDAMNLDGGGSTTMYLDGKVVNTPSDKEGERKVGDAIVVTLRKPGKR